MEGSIRNRDLHPIGTRVCIAYDKFVTKIGTVVEYGDESDAYFRDTMAVLWDGNKYPISGYSIPELKEVKEN